MRVPRLLPLAAIACLFLAGCAQLPRFSGGSGAAQQVAVQSPDDTTVRPEPRPDSRPDRARAAQGGGGLGATGLTVATLDQTSAAERAAAMAPPASRTQLLGETLASLGSPSESGLWLRTGLVTRVQQGRIEPETGGNSLRVELRPSGAPAGGGSQLSLSAYTSLGVPLTQLVRLRVFAE